MTQKKANKTAFPVTHRAGRPPSRGLYIDLDVVDGRTRLGKAISALKKELRKFIGESTPSSELLIQRIIYKAIRLSLYEANSLNNPVEVKESDHYLPMSNSLRLDLQALAQMANSKPSKVPSIEEIVSKAKEGK